MRLVDKGVKMREELIPAPKKIQPTPVELNNYFKDPEIEDLVQEATAYCQRQLQMRDINSLVYMKYQLGFPFDLIEYLLEYAAEVKKTNFNYIEKIARNWFEEGIETREEAEELNWKPRSLFINIMNAIGIKSRYSPTPSEKKYIDRWTNEYGFSEQIIIEACNKANLTRPNDVTFPYINGILENWYKNNIKTIEDIKELDKKRSEQKKIQEQNLFINDEQIERIEKIDIKFAPLFHKIEEILDKEPDSLDRREKNKVYTWLTDYKTKPQEIVDACREAKKHDKKNIDYVNGILKNWMMQQLQFSEMEELIEYDFSDEKGTDYQ